MDDFFQDENSKKKKKVTVFGLPKFRERVLDMLQAAYSNQNLTTEEYEKRLDIAHNCLSVEELEDAIYDFPSSEKAFLLGDELPSTRNATSPSPAQNFLQNVEEAETFTNIIGAQHISSFDVTEPIIKIVSGIGETTIDLRGIAAVHSHLRVKIYGGIGSLMILVPANARVKKKDFTMIIGSLAQTVKGDGFWAKLFGNKVDALIPAKPSTAPPVYIELSGLMCIGEVTIQYDKGEDYLSFQ